MANRALTRLSFGLFAIVVLLSGFLLAADFYAPFSSQGVIQAGFIDIAPEVPGKVTTIYVRNGDHVMPGDRLFDLDVERYQLALEKAQAQLAQVLEQNQGLKVAITQALAREKQAQSDLKQVQAHTMRVRQLFSKGLINKEALEQAETELVHTQQQVIIHHNAVINARAKIQRDGENAALKLALNQLQHAQYNVSRTRVVATSTGSITNQALTKGTYLHTGKTALTLVAQQNQWLAVDFLEKGGDQLKPGSQALVVFDANPTTLVKGYISSVDTAVSSAKATLGSAADVQNDTHWVRPKQRIRVRIQFNHAPKSLIVGSRASAMIIPQQSDIWSVLSHIWMRGVSLARMVL